MITKGHISRTRRTEYNELLRVLKDPSPAGAIILGGLGMGKTSLVESVLEELGIQESVMRLYCAQFLNDVPYGALSPYLGGLDTIDDPVAVLRELNRALLPTPNQPASRVVVVEDAQYLDAESCFILSLLVENDAMKLVAIGADTLGAQSQLSFLSEIPAVSSIVMQPLDHEGVREVAEFVVGRKMSDGAIRIIERASAGNPKFVQAYMLSCLDQGTLFLDESLVHNSNVHEPVWNISRALPEIDARLLALGRELNRFVPEDEQQTLELLALAGPQSPAMLDESALPYRRLVNVGELIIREGVVAIKAKLLQRVYHSLASEQQSSDLHALWSNAAAKLGVQPNAREILWRLELGVEVPWEEILDQAEQAARDLNYRVALRLCLLGGLAQKHERGALLEAQVLLGTGRHYAARAMLLRLTEHLQDLELLGQAFVYLLEVTACIEIDAVEVKNILEMWRQRAEGHEDRDAVERYLELQSLASQVLDFWIRTNSASGDLPSIQEMHRFLNNPALPVQIRIIGMVTLSDRYSSAGMGQEAVGLLEPAMQLLKKNPAMRSLYEVRVFFRIGWNLLFMGDYQRAREFIDKYRCTRLRTIQHYQGAVSLLDGINHLLQSRVQMALSKIAEAITELRLFDTTQILALANNLYRLLMARLGTPIPDALAFGPDAREPGGGVSLAGELGKESSELRIFARAFAAALGNPYEGESIRDFPLIEREVLFSKTRQLSDEDLARSADGKRLLVLAGEQQGSRAALLAQLMELRTSSDGESLERLAQIALEKDEHLVVIEAWARAAERYAASGDQRRCGALLRRVAGMLEQHGMDSGKYVARVLAITELTARETEIVNLARQGLNNAQIARELTVSQRTVEGHLYRVFSKLGITQRAELNHAGLQTGAGRR